MRRVRLKGTIVRKSLGYNENCDPYLYHLILLELWETASHIVGYWLRAYNTLYYSTIMVNTLSNNTPFHLALRSPTLCDGVHYETLGIRALLNFLLIIKQLESC